MFLLSGSLPKLLEVNPHLTAEGNNLVRSGACECMANIGEETFAKLPVSVILVGLLEFMKKNIYQRFSTNSYIFLKCFLRSDSFF